MAIKIGINGFGRIGRCVTRIIYQKGWQDRFQVVHINDITDEPTLAHLLKYDSNHGIFPSRVKADKGLIQIDQHQISISAIKDPAQLPWKEKKVDIVLECTGAFTKREDLAKHLEAGAPRVLLSAPAKGKDVPTFVYGVNHASYNPDKDKIYSNASCTTNCLAPVAKVLHQNFRIQRGFMTTIHAYTNDQRILDLPHKDLRRARAAALSMIPTTTGAARAVGLVLPELAGKLDGIAIRVPTPNVSVVDLVAVVEKEVTAEQVNKALKAASEGELAGILGYCEEPLVSIDFNGSELSGIVDASNTGVIDNHLVKVLAWYDNEWGYSTRMLDLIKHTVG